MTPQSAAAMTLLGRRVRAVVKTTGEVPGLRVDDRGDRIPVRSRSRTVVVGTVIGWEAIHFGATYVDIGGYGRVPVETVRRARWWHR